MERFYTAAARTDAGAVKSVNQDNLLMRIAGTDADEILFAVLCDGMGGLKKGELASAKVVKAFDDWFGRKLPALTDRNVIPDLIRKQIRSEWDDIIQNCNEEIVDYAKAHVLNMGTTLTALLLWQDTFYLVHVGDCRIYEMSEKGIRQLTKDQTYVAREVMLGHMTPEQASNDIRRNVLLQCIGTDPVIEPYFGYGMIKKDAVYLVCSDGFWRIPSIDELYMECYEDLKALDWGKIRTDVNSLYMEEKLEKIIEQDKRCGERDNLSAILIKT